MKYIPFVALMILTACSGYTTGYTTPQALTATPEAGETAQATPEMVNAAAAQVEAMSTQAPAPTAADTVGTQMALVHALETKQAEINTLREQSKQADVDIANAQAAQAASKAESDKYNAAQAEAEAHKKDGDAQLLAADAARIQADNEAKQIELAAKQAEAEAERAHLAQIIAFSFVAVVAIGVIAMLRLVNLRTQEAVARAPRETGPAQPTTHYVTETAAGAHIERVPPPPGGITPEWLHWAYLARIGHSVAYNMMTGRNMPYSNSTDYGPVYQWAWRNKIIARNVKGVTVLTERGEQYLDDELIRAEYHAPAPSMDEPQIVPPANHAQDNPEHDPSGEVVEA